jgi:hypothetical protein
MALIQVVKKKAISRKCACHNGRWTYIDVCIWQAVITMSFEYVIGDCSNVPCRGNAGAGKCQADHPGRGTVEEKSDQCETAAGKESPSNLAGATHWQDGGKSHKLQEDARKRTALR